MRRTPTEILDSLEEQARIDGVARFVSGRLCVLARYARTTGCCTWYADGQPLHRERVERAIEEARASAGHPFALNGARPA